jgi:hypothetical protein
MTSETRVRFDLSESSADAKRFRQSWRAFGAIFVVVGAGVAVSGGVLLAIHLGASDIPYDIAVGIYLIAGVAVAVGSLPIARQSRAYPTLLSVSEREMTLGFASPAEPVVWLWHDPRLRFDLIDRKGLPATHPDGTPRPRYALRTSGSGPWVPIPAEAFDLLLKHAESNGLRVVRREIRASTVPGTFVEISVRRLPRSK